MKLIVVLLISLVVSTPFDNQNDVSSLYAKASGQASLDFEIFSGYIPINWQYESETTQAVFYQFVTKVGSTLKTNTKAVPLVIWLQGGPGCSSQFGFFGEIGPFGISQNGNTLKANPRATSWNLDAHLLFVDNPLGAGLSYSSSNVTINSTSYASVDFSNFIFNFFSNPLYQTLQQNPIIIFGESFAGHYIPVFTQGLLSNQFVKSLNLNIQGVGIGDGWTSLIDQIQYSANYMYSIGIIDSNQLNYITKLQSDASTAAEAGDFEVASEAFDYITGTYLAQNCFGVNEYNFQQYPTVPPAPSSVDPYVTFILENSAALTGEAKPPVYQDCNEQIYTNFLVDIAQSKVSSVISLLNSGLKVLLYNGQLDIIVNTPGALQWINKMNWSGLQNWQQKTKQLLKDSSISSPAPYGTYKTDGQFTFASIFQAGHMVPKDQPLAAQYLFRQFINGNFK